MTKLISYYQFKTVPKNPVIKEHVKILKLPIAFFVKRIIVNVS